MMTLNMTAAQEINWMSEREAKVAKVYLGNIKVVWTNGDNVAAAPRTDQPQQAAAPQPVDDDLPF